MNNAASVECALPLGTVVPLCSPPSALVKRFTQARLCAVSSQV